MGIREVRDTRTREGPYVHRRIKVYVHAQTDRLADQTSRPIPGIGRYFKWYVLRHAQMKMY